MGIAENIGVLFTQEVIAAAKAIKTYYPQTDVVIELGGRRCQDNLPQRRSRTKDERNLCRGNGSFHRPDGVPVRSRSGGIE